jgi:hypothetical protein
MIFQRYGVSALREISEDWMDDRRTKRADVGDLRALGEDGVGHDRPVAAEFVHPRIELDVGALAGGPENALAEFRDRGDRGEVFSLAGAEPNRGDDRVDETVETEDGLLGSERVAAVAKLLEGAGLEVHWVR